MMKRVIAFTMLFFVLAVPLSITSNGSDKEIEQLKKEVKIMRDSMEALSEKLETSNTSISIAKDYSDKADKLHDNFFSRFDVLLNAITVGFFTFLIGLFLFLWQLVKGIFDKKTKDAIKLYDDQFKHFLDSKDSENKKMISRLVGNENNTIFLKENTFILFIHKTNTFSERTTFGQIQKAIFSEFKNEKQTYSSTIDEIIDNIAFTKLTNSSFTYKLIVMDDKLFDDLLIPDSKGEFTENGKNSINSFVKKLEDENIGLVIFGNTRLPNKPTYFAFAQSPYTLYSNLNNLLKYMYVIQPPS